MGKRGLMVVAVPPKCAVMSVCATSPIVRVRLSSFWVVEQFLMGPAGNFTHNPIEYKAKTNDRHNTNNEKHK